MARNASKKMSFACKKPLRFQYLTRRHLKFGTIWHSSKLLKSASINLTTKPRSAPMKKSKLQFARSSTTPSFPKKSLMSSTRQASASQIFPFSPMNSLLKFKAWNARTLHWNYSNACLTMKSKRAVITT